MELHLKPIARQSAHSGAVFQPGQSIVCLLFLDADGAMQRLDLLESESVNHPVEGTVLCRWVRRVRERDVESEAVARRQAVSSAEDLFFALTDAEASEAETLAGGVPAVSVPLLKHLLALMLDRKRVLRPVRGVRGRYRHVKSGEEYDVPAVAFQPEELLPLQDALQALV